MPAAFDRCFEALIGHEGGFTDDRRDPGNWTGGKVGAGRLLGTKFGIAANSFPDLDIPGLTVAQAKAIYKARYWDAVGGDAMPPVLGLVVFDAAVNNGVSRAGKWLQTALGVPADGAVGPATLAALRARLARDPGAALELAMRFHLGRVEFMTGLGTWATFGKGWAKRLARLPFEAAALAP